MKLHKLAGLAAIGVVAGSIAVVATGGLGAATKEKAEAPASHPPADSAAVAAGAKVFATYCQTCHGSRGRGDGPASAGLNPKPRNFTDPKQFKSKDDDGLFAVISKGGAANKLSAAMPSWKLILKPEQIWQVIAYVRTFAPRDTTAAGTAAKATPADTAKTDGQAKPAEQ